MTDPSPLGLCGKVALVTGGAVGLGRGIATALAAAGADIALTWNTHEQEAQDVAHEIGAMGRRVLSMHLDATGAQEVDTGIARIVQELGQLDICVNNAGGLVGRVTVDAMSQSHWEGVLGVNVSSTFLCTRAALAHLPNGGRIVNMSSLAAFNGGGQGYVAYAAAKAAICGFTRALAKELAPRRITVNAVAPGFILDTPFHATFTPANVRTAISNAIPLGRAGVPADVSSAVAWLCSPASAWITGEVVQVNGGHYFA